MISHPIKVLSRHPSLSAYFTTRHGGVSSIPFDSFNLAFHVGDNELDVRHNHRILGTLLDYDPRKLIHMRQIHSDIIVTVNAAMDFETPVQCDALMTDFTDTPLMVMSADCTPILLYDPIHHAIAAVHAGRAGALNEILLKTIKAMKQTYGTSESALLVALGPSIHGCCYEINESIAYEVTSKGYEKALIRNEEKVSLDVNTILQMQLDSLGISKGQIETINACTSCHCNDYFSYRADLQHTGRIAGVIVLRPLPS